jgi:hypothetical protein
MVKTSGNPEQRSKAKVMPFPVIGAYNFDNWRKHVDGIGERDPSHEALIESDKKYVYIGRRGKLWRVKRKYIKPSPPIGPLKVR